MKTNTLKASLIFILALLLLDSCTLTKRRYNKGFHVDWFNGGNNKNKTKTMILKTSPPKVQPIEKVIATNKNNTNNATTITSPKYRKIKNINQIKKSHITDNQGSTNGLRTIVQNEAKTKEYKTSSQKFTSHSRKLKDRIKPQVSQQKTESNSSRGIGIFLLILGIFILIFASILLGALLVILGIVLMSKKPKSNQIPAAKTENKEKEISYIDVVYLKNGSIIKGQVLDQTPGVSLKIQTSGGSIFVYKMEEVEKITKERKQN